MSQTGWLLVRLSGSILRAFVFEWWGRRLMGIYLFYSWAAGLFMYQSLDAVDGYVWIRLWRERCKILKCILANKHVGREWRGPLGKCSIMVWPNRSQKKMNVEFDYGFKKVVMLWTRPYVPRRSKIPLTFFPLVGSHPQFMRARTRTVMVDRHVGDPHARQLLSDDVGGVPHRCFVSRLFLWSGGRHLDCGGYLSCHGLSWYVVFFLLFSLEEMILIHRNVVLGDESVDLARPRNRLSIRLYSEFTA